MLCLCGLLLIFGLAADGTVASDPAKIVGPNACAECHKQEAEAWKDTHHFKTFREMPRRKEANEIAEKMGVQRIRSEEYVPDLPLHSAGEGKQEAADCRHFLRVLPQRR